MFDRIQILFERFVGVPAEQLVALPSVRRLPESMQRPACWRRAKRIGTGR